MIYTFIEAQKANHRVSVMCRALKVSKSGFYGWRDRAPSARAHANAHPKEKIARIHRDSRETYEAPRIHFELRMLGVRCARKRVARLMREAGLCGCGGRRRKVRTTLRSQTKRIPPAPDLVKRDFTPEAPDRLWVADITYVRTWEGWLYLSFVLDAYSRMVVGWSMANNLRTELVLDAVNMAIYTRRPQPGLIHYSDRGSQYTSVEFGGRLIKARLLPSMGSVADAYDNSMAESFVSTLKRKLIHRHSWTCPRAPVLRVNSGNRASKYSARLYVERLPSPDETSWRERRRGTGAESAPHLHRNPLPDVVLDA
ncbi:MAG: IS3 family transposase [Rubrobacteraceae bacterium]